MKIRIELSPLASQHQSGVAQYTKLLVDAFLMDKTVDLSGFYFNFGNRQPKPEFKSPIKTTDNTYVPLRIYAKLQSFNIAPPFDILLPAVDLTIFPNFATWPTIKSKYSATVIHDLTYLYFPEVVEERNLSHLQRVVPRSIKRADIIITVSESVKAELVKEFDLEPDTCIVTPIPPDAAFFKILPQKNITSIKKKYAINKEYIYFIGNLEPRKNLRTLIQAYRLLPQEIKDKYSLVLAGGKGWKTEETKAALNDALAAGEDIKHLGFIPQEDSPALYQGARLFVMPSLYEGFGMPILEAMACGTPVVASDIPVLKEVGSTYATYADPSSPHSFRQAIETALNSRRPSAETLRQNVHRFSWEKNIESIINATRALG